MKKRYAVLFWLCLFVLCISVSCPAQSHNLRNRASYQARYRNPIASIPIEKAQKDLIGKLTEVYPNHKQKRIKLFSKGMSDYVYLSRANDAASVRILSGLIRIYYPHFTTIRLLYEQKIRGGGTRRY